VEPLALLATNRLRPAVAVAGRGDDAVLVVAGGYPTAGGPNDAIGDAELFDPVTLEPIAVVPLITARGGAALVVLPNDNVVLLGGRTGEGGVPVGTTEVFTP
jgi:hypothetical protein